MACTISYHDKECCTCFGQLSGTPKKDWKPGDLRKAVDLALDDFVKEFFNAPSYRTLNRKDKLSIARALKADATERFTYEWLMRTA